MKRWALLVVLLYGAVLTMCVIALAVPAFWPRNEWNLSAWLFLSFDESWWAWCFLGVMLLTEGALLVVPVRMVAEVPVPKRHLAWGYLVAAVASLVLLAGIAISLWEHVMATDESSTRTWAILLAVVGSLWLGWTILFSFYTGKNRPVGPMGRLVRWLLAGSIAEILVVIPMHAVARYRNYCCAGYMTFAGLAAGMAVLLLAFGPGAFVLLARRLRSYRR